MQLVSFQPEDGSVALTSIPRDLLAPIPGYGLRKINNANAFGEVQNPGAGGELATQVVSQILDLPIPYYARIDFNGFVQIVDDLNGVVIDVENTLDDRSYPVPGKETATTTERYQHLHIPAGRQKMDGELALKYVRSRSAIGAEGSDFARSKRQQNLLLAIKDKVVSFGTLANPIRISNLMETFSQHFTSNLELWEISRLLKLAKNVDEENITRIVFDDSPDGLLQASLTADGAFVLTPKAGDFSELQAVVHNVFNPDQPAKLRPQKVEIQNGTRVNGLAYDVSLYLQSLGFNVIKTGNAPTQDYARTVVYDLKKNDVENKTREIVELLNADQAPTLPEWLTATSSTLVSPNADIVIILGQDQRP
jgi:LCP family protein required for cell wall assembly